MSGNFDWQTDDGWDQEPPSSEQPAGQRPRRRWPVFALIAIILGGLGYIAVREINTRTDQVVEAADDNLLASFEQMFRADRQQDPELLRDILSGRDEGWATSAQINAELGTLYQRESWGWSMVGEPRLVSQTLSADLTEYTLRFAIDFDVQTVQGPTEQVTVEHVARFRQGDNNKWLLTPLPDSYWGESRQIDGNLMSTTFPEIDNEFGRSFAQQVERIVSRTCNELSELGCSSEIEIELLLSNDLASLNSLNNPQDQLDGRNQFKFPTPSLFGRPTTEAGEKVLADTYLRLIASGIIGQQVDYQCCQNVIFYQWLLNEQLAQIGLSQGNGFAANVPQFAGYEESWQSETSLETPGQLAIFFDFLMSRNGLEIAGLQRTLNQEYETFWDWVYAIENERHTAAGLNRQFAEFTTTRLGVPITLVRDEELLLSCYDGRSATINLHRFNPHSSELTPAISLNEGAAALYSLIGLANNGQLYLNTISIGTEPASFNAWELQNNSLIPALPEAAANQLLLGIGGLNSQYALALQFQESQVPFNTSPLGIMYSLDDCASGDCAGLAIDGLPVWSPSGEQSIFLETEFGQIYSESFLLGMVEPLQYEVYDLSWGQAPFTDAIGFGAGTAPYWINEQEISYVTTVDDVNVVVALQVTDLSNPRVIVSMADLWPAIEMLPEVINANDSTMFEIVAATPNPADPEQLFLVVAEGPIQFQGNKDRRHHFVSYNLATSAPSYIVTELGAYYGISVSPKGNVLTIYSEIDNRSFGRIIYHNVDTGITNIESRRDTTLIELTQRFGHQTGVLWSPSGDWVFSFAEAMRLWSPQTGEELEAPYSRGIFYCYDALWLEGETLFTD